MRSKWIPKQDLELVFRLLTPANALVMRVALATGLRVGDVLALTIAQVASGASFRVTEQKTGRKRRISLPTALRAEMLRSGGTYWVFPGRVDPAKHRTRQAVWKDVKRAAKAARLGQGVSPHTARKAFAVALMAKYGDVERVREVLGHQEVSTTYFYALADKLTVARK